MRTAVVDQGCSSQQEKVESFAVSVRSQGVDHMRSVAGLAIGWYRRSAGRMCKCDMRGLPARHRK